MRYVLSLFLFMAGMTSEFFASHPQYWVRGNPNADSIVAFFIGLPIIWMSIALLFVKDKEE